MLSTSATAIVPAQHPDAPALRLACAGATHVGLQRPTNEDRYGIHPDLGLFLVADGVGGGAAGEVAAQMTVDLVRDALALPEATQGGGLPALVAAVQRANQGVYEAAQGTAAWAGMASTVAAVLAAGTRAVIAHAGDSRIYRLRGDRLTLLTEDHSLFNALARRGLVDPDRPEDCARGHMILRAVGPEPSVDVDARVIDVMPGDTLLLCTDGLSGVVPLCEMTEILRDRTDLDGAVAELVAGANRHGGPDNVTAVAVRWEPVRTAARVRA